MTECCKAMKVFTSTTAVCTLKGHTHGCQLCHVHAHYVAQSRLMVMLLKNSDRSRFTVSYSRLNSLTLSNDLTVAILYTCQCCLRLNTEPSDRLSICVHSTSTKHCKSKQGWQTSRSTHRDFNPIVQKRTFQLSLIKLIDPGTALKVDRIKKYTNKSKQGQ